MQFAGCDNMNLKDRKKQILKIIVRHYIENGQPIGSKAVVDILDQKVSTATVRNEMAALEEMGFLVQPHISAGRIPSDLAYRFYVDALMDEGNIGADEIMVIKNAFNVGHNNVKSVIADAVKVLSDITNCVAVALLPKTANLQIQSIHLVGVTSDKALVVIVTNHGIIKDRVISIPTGMGQTELDAIAGFITEQVKGVKDVKSIKTEDYISCLDKGAEVIGSFLDILSDDSVDDDVIIEGAMNIFDFPEYDSVEKAKTLISSFQDKNMLIDVLSRPVDGINIIIGQESQVEAIKNCSLLSVSYDLGGGDVGKFGIIGPKRMNYGRMLKILELLSGNIQYLFDDNSEV